MPAKHEASSFRMTALDAGDEGYVWQHLKLAGVGVLEKNVVFLIDYTAKSGLAGTEDVKEVASALSVNLSKYSYTIFPIPFLRYGTMEHVPMKLTVHHRFSLLIPEPFDFPRTVAKPAGWHWSTPKEVYLDGVLWSGVYISDEPVGLKMAASGNRVTVDVYSGSVSPKEWIDEVRSVIRSGLGADEDLEGFYRFAKDDPVLSLTVQDLYGMRTGLVDDVFGGTILAILLQMAPMSRSEQMMEALLQHFGIRIEFDGKEVTLWPRPADLAGVDEILLRKEVNLGYRAKRLVMAARYLNEHLFSLRELAALPEEEAVKRLTGIPGIGPYSAGIILGRTLLPLDVWSVVIMSELFLGRTPQNPRQEIDEVAGELTKRWGRWRWFAFVYVLNDLEKLAEIFRLTRIR
jgi:DNA-3-methyladenine glycosylase II